MPYKIPQPRKCPECEGQCYATDWFETNTSGRSYNDGEVKVYWHCLECKYKFNSMEVLDAILIEVEELPTSRYGIASIAVEKKE